MAMNAAPFWMERPSLSGRVLAESKTETLWKREGWCGKTATPTLLLGEKTGNTQA